MSLINIFAKRHGAPGEDRHKKHGSISDIVPK
jgi:hypothetical protein